MAWNELIYYPICITEIDRPVEVGIAGVIVIVRIITGGSVVVV
jgi:hypothetical protein